MLTDFERKLGIAFIWTVIAGVVFLWMWWAFGLGKEKGTMNKL